MQLLKGLPRQFPSQIFAPTPEMVPAGILQIVFIFKFLPNQSSFTFKILNQFFDKLPTSFRRKEAITLAEAELGIKERTADLYLSKLVAFKWIEKTRNGIYQKIKH